MLFRQFFSKEDYKNFCNKSYFDLILFIATIEYLDRHSGVGWYNKKEISS